MSRKELNFFASMNTAYGFHSEFHSIFDPNQLNKIYILKGGPGCGKSSVMKYIADYAEEKGKIVERFFCSSDPNSLDGIILKEEKIAIVDGTAPHQIDPNFPGIVENIVNLGSFWNIKKILPYKKEILELIQEKKNAYQSAYQFLEAYGKVSEEILHVSKKALLEDKMLHNLNIQCNYFFKNENKSKFNSIIRNVSTICKDGIIQFKTFENESKKIWIIDDYLFTGYMYLEALEQNAKNNNLKFYKSISPQFNKKINALYFPDTKTCFILGKRDYSAELEGKEYHYINMKRFLDEDKISQGKKKIKFALKCNEELLHAAAESLLEAAKKHEKLEQHYISAMNFEKIDKVQKEIEAEIFQV